MRTMLCLSMLALGCSQPGNMPVAPTVDPPTLYELHVCIDGNCVAFMSDEPASSYPSTRLREWVGNAIAGVRQAGTVQFADHLPAPEPTRIPQPVLGDWGDDPAPLYTCTCAVAMYSESRQFLGCTLPGCDGCLICVRR